MKTGSLDAVSNRATFQMERQIIDTETGEAIDLSGVTFAFRDQPRSDIAGRRSRPRSTTASSFWWMTYTYQVTFSSERNAGALRRDVLTSASPRPATTSPLKSSSALLPVLDGDVTLMALKDRGLIKFPAKVTGSQGVGVTRAKRRLRFPSGLHAVGWRVPADGRF
jgi:hypothetical protein